jgi:hypothetical protein
MSIDLILPFCTGRNLSLAKPPRRGIVPSRNDPFLLQRLQMLLQFIPQQFILTSVREKDFNGGLIHTAGQTRLHSVYLASHILAKEGGTNLPIGRKSLGRGRSPVHKNLNCQQLTACEFFPSLRVKRLGYEGLAMPSWEFLPSFKFLLFFCNDTLTTRRLLK